MKQLNNNLFGIDPATEKNKIASFIKTVLEEQRFKNVVLGMSGGIDSTVSFLLLKEVLAPSNIFIAHLPYSKSYFKDIEDLLKKANIPQKNIYNLSISSIVEPFQKILHSSFWEASATPESVLPQDQRDSGHLPANALHRQLQTGARMTDLQQIRLGNIMARIRMIILFDLAKKHNALVVGTENKSENLLGYFTRFGDQASDIEPIQHLYKTQVYELAKFLNVPKNIIAKEPTAGLWHGQTDEGEFGFTYKEADQVLNLYYDKKLKIEEIENRGFENAEKIINFAIRNSYKRGTPYILLTAKSS